MSGPGDRSAAQRRLVCTPAEVAGMAGIHNDRNVAMSAWLPQASYPCASCRLRLSVLHRPAAPQGQRAASRGAALAHRSGSSREGAGRPAANVPAPAADLQPAGELGCRDWLVTVAWDGGTTATPTPAYLTSLGPLSGHSSSPPSPPSQFMSLHNVGDYLVEVPTELAKRVPKDWAKVGGTAHASRADPLCSQHGSSAP